MITPQKKHVDRNENDKYLTPHTLTQILLDAIQLDKSLAILEPCSSIEKCIANVLTTNGYDVSINVFEKSKPETDFLTFDETKKYDVCFTNTPYGDKNVIAFVNKMKCVANYQVIALYPLSILHGSNKYTNLWNDKSYGLKYVYVLVRPPWLTDFVREDGKYSSGINQYAWFIWENGYDGKPMIDWLDNASHLINRKLYFV